ncbi:MAG TPA: glycosyltransferase family 4 protein, partial [Nitrolancea sp.]|nr:glycosyltransferase family 4 protein [Nitrolancea sp.]
EPSHYVHLPTGATISLLPVPRIYRALRRLMLYPYGQSVRQVFGEIRGPRRLLLPLYWFLKEAAFYLHTPPRALARELRHFQCDAILCQEYEYPRFDISVLLGKLMRIPVYASFQGGNYRSCHAENYTRPLAIRACAGLIVGSQSEIRRVRSHYRLPEKRLAAIFNPVDIETWHPDDRCAARASLDIPLRASIVAWHGRISLHKKGLDTLLSAWEQVCREHAGRDLRLLLIGSGDDAAELRSRLDRLQLPGVHWIDQFVHETDKLRLYLSAADVYAFSSRYEGFPVAPIEAMACGLPVVATDVDGIRDIFEAGEASGGVIVPPEEAAAFARALGRLLDDPGLARELGKRARCRAESHFSLTAIGRQLREFMLGSAIEA